MSKNGVNAVYSEFAYFRQMTFSESLVDREDDRLPFLQERLHLIRIELAAEMLLDDRIIADIAQLMDNAQYNIELEGFARIGRNRSVIERLQTLHDIIEYFLMRMLARSQAFEQLADARDQEHRFAIGASKGKIGNMACRSHAPYVAAAHEVDAGERIILQCEAELGFLQSYPLRHSTDEPELARIHRDHLVRLSLRPAREHESLGMIDVMRHTI